MNIGIGTMTAVSATTLTSRHPPMSATATLANCYVPLSAAFHAEELSSSSSPSSTGLDPFLRPPDDANDDGNTLGGRNRDDDDDDGDGGDRPASVERRRGPRGLRQIRLDRSILSQSDGSSLVEWGHTKLMVSVRGPRPVNCSSMNAANNGGGLICEVRYMPHIGVRMETLAQHSLSHDFSSKVSGGARVPRDAIGTAQDTSLLSSGGSPCAPAAFLDETYLSHRLQEALSPAVILEGLGNKMCIEVFVEVLQSDGGVFNAAVVGASLALADAGVGLRDVVCASSAAVMRSDAADISGTDGEGSNKAKVLYRAVADPTEDEILRASGVVTIAMMPNWREVTVWDQFGKMPMEVSSEAMELARDGCVTMHKFLKNCLLNDKGVR